MSALVKLRPDAPTKGVVDVVDEIIDKIRRHRVRCPSCGWQPGPASQWGCVTTEAPEHFSPGCGTSWNTFQTRGRCPGCSHQWKYTACLNCHAWAKHEEWYSFEDDD